VRPPAGPVGLISNPTSGHNRDQFDRIRSLLERHPRILHRVTDSPADIPGALDEFAARHVTVLAINGGDGTVAAVLGDLLERKLFATPPVIALLPGGTANMTAGDVGLRGALPAAVARFCQWTDGGRASRGPNARRAMLRLDTGTGEPRYGMFLGGGAIINGTEYAHRELHSRGLRDDFSLALGTVRTVWGVVRADPAFNRHVTVSVALDGQPPVRHDTLILALSTLERLAFGMRPFWGTGPGRIRMTLMEQGCTRFARTFFAIARGRPNRNAVPASGYHSHNADRVALALEGTLNLDGELLQIAGDVTVTASPTLEFLRL